MSQIDKKQITTEPELPPQKVYPLSELVPPTSAEPFYHDYETGVPIVIDLGRSHIRAGLATKSYPSNVFPSVIAKFRDRKINKTLTMIGNDVFIDSSLRSNLRTPFDGPMITNWETIEQMLDYSFNHIGVNSNGFVDNPLVISEVLATPLQQRQNMMQLLFEGYRVPKATFGVDSLFSFYYNGGTSGLVIGSGSENSHIIPVVDRKPLLTYAKRVDWGGEQAVGYLSKSIHLKYPYFPTKITDAQVKDMLHEFCYVSKDYDKEIKDYLDLNNLEKNDIVIQAPFTEIIKPQKTEEELKLEAEKKRETIRRLQEQAQKSRLEKLVQKETDFEYFSALKEKLKTLNKKETISTLRTEGFDDEPDLIKYIAKLEKSLKKARNEDIGEDNSDEPPNFPLVDIADDQLDEEQIKEKRKQRLMKSNYDARQRAKKEKEEARLLKEEEERKDREWRQTDLSSWIEDRRTRLDDLIKKKKERTKLKEELNDRKSRAAQQRMKNIASLASNDTNYDSSSTTGRRKRANITIDDDPNDTFGADDDDWAIYRDIANADDEEAIEEEEQKLLEIEQELLEFDPNFTIEDTLQRQFDWRKSIIHRFLRGPRDYDPEEIRQQHQLHLNVERIKVPEILFKPSIAGIDQAGITEISENVVLKRLSNPLEKDLSDYSKKVLSDIFITGGNTLFKSFDERLHNEFNSFLPVGTKFRVRRAEDPLLDAWKGMAKWSVSDEAVKSYITRKEYEEMGPDYIKENNLGFINL
ncbi:hypothetical protein BVG19_g2039 [[Candida] boidinii]|nr:hypothetical protein BVG19_g2039 [[Candida] boidinii]OWB48796.1 hypothetical protein B5S27_g333 [[Candida] boidinii]